MKPFGKNTPLYIIAISSFIFSISILYHFILADTVKEKKISDCFDLAQKEYEEDWAKMCEYQISLYSEVINKHGKSSYPPDEYYEAKERIQPKTPDCRLYDGVGEKLHENLEKEKELCIKSLK